MIFRYLLILIILFPIKAFSLIEVDITRGNLSPLPVAVSPLSVDSESKKSFEKLLNKSDFSGGFFFQQKNTTKIHFFRSIKTIFFGVEKKMGGGYSFDVKKIVSFDL